MRTRQTILCKSLLGFYHLTCQFHFWEVSLRRKNICRLCTKWFVEVMFVRANNNPKKVKKYQQSLWLSTNGVCLRSLSPWYYTENSFSQVTQAPLLPVILQSSLHISSVPLTTMHPNYPFNFYTRLRFLEKMNLWISRATVME